MPIHVHTLESTSNIPLYVFNIQPGRFIPFIINFNISNRICASETRGLTMYSVNISGGPLFNRYLIFGHVGTYKSVHNLELKYQ